MKTIKQRESARKLMKERWEKVDSITRSKIGYENRMKQLKSKDEQK